MTTVKKIRCRKPSNLFDKRKNNPGRPTLKEIKELNPNMRNFAHLVANGKDPKKAGAMIGISDYKVRTWMELELVKTEIDKWKLIYANDEYEKWVLLDNEIKLSAALQLKKRIEEGEVSERLLKELYDEKSILLGLKKIQDACLPNTNFRQKPKLIIEDRKRITVTNTSNEERNDSNTKDIKSLASSFEDDFIVDGVVEDNDIDDEEIDDGNKDDFDED